MWGMFMDEFNYQSVQLHPPRSTVQHEGGPNEQEQKLRSLKMDRVVVLPYHLEGFPSN